MRRVAFLLAALTVVLAGCSGGPAADGQVTTTTDGDGASDDGRTDGGDGSGDGSGGDGGAASGDGGDADGAAAVWRPLEFSEPARYEFRIHESGVADPGSLVWDVTEVSGDAITVHLTFEHDGSTAETTVSGDPNTVRSQLFVTPAGPVMMATVFSPMVGYYEGHDLRVGNEWEYSTPQGSASFAVTGTETLAGVECYRSEVRVDGAVVYEGCFAPDLGLAAHSAFYEQDGTASFELELVGFERH